MGGFRDSREKVLSCVAGVVERPESLRNYDRSLQ